MKLKKRRHIQKRAKQESSKEFFGRGKTLLVHYIMDVKSIFYSVLLRMAWFQWGFLCCLCFGCGLTGSWERTEKGILRERIGKYQLHEFHDSSHPLSTYHPCQMQSIRARKKCTKTCLLLVVPLGQAGLGELQTPKWRRWQGYQSLREWQDTCAGLQKVFDQSQWKSPAGFSICYLPRISLTSIMVCSSRSRGMFYLLLLMLECK